MSERRKDTAKDKEEDHRSESTFAECRTVIQHVLDGRKTECDHAAENDTVENVIEITSEKDQQDYQTEALGPFLKDGGRDDRRGELARILGHADRHRHPYDRINDHGYKDRDERAPRKGKR